MFNKDDFYDRLQVWKDLRSELETSATPIKLLKDFYRQAPLVTIAADPYDQEVWPNPWEQVEENIYCPFSVILAICYCLQLSTRFSQSSIEIHIGTDEKREQIIYCLLLDKRPIGLWDEDDTPNVISREVYDMTL